LDSGFTWRQKVSPASRKSVYCCTGLLLWLDRQFFTMPDAVTLYHRGGDLMELQQELSRVYGARQGTHYRVGDYPEEELDLEEEVPVLGVEQEALEGEIHHIGEDTILEAFDAFNLEHLERELEQ
jgi:hypothetical protein